jgi:flagellar biosynthesis/type III secretory pathway chaperone
MTDYTKKFESQDEYFNPNRYSGNKIPEEIERWAKLADRLEKERNAFFENGIVVARERDVLQKKLEIAMKALEHYKSSDMHWSVSPEFADDAFTEIERIK